MGAGDIRRFELGATMSGATLCAMLVTGAVAPARALDPAHVVGPPLAAHILLAQAATQPESTLPKSVLDELRPQPALGPRTLHDLSPQAREVRRAQLLHGSRRVMPPVPPEVKQQMYDSMTGASPMSMTELFNYMTAKKKVAEGVTFDDVVEAMEIKANDVNFKIVGHNKFWRDVGAISGMATTRVEVLQFCDALVGRRMLDYSPEFSIFIPCRITVYEDANGEIWLMMLDWDVSWMAKAWQPGSQIDEQLTRDAVRIRDAMTQIMEAGATGEIF